MCTLEALDILPLKTSLCSVSNLIFHNYTCLHGVSFLRYNRCTRFSSRSFDLSRFVSPRRLPIDLSFYIVSIIIVFDRYHRIVLDIAFVRLIHIIIQISKHFRFCVTLTFGKFVLFCVLSDLCRKSRVR